MKTKQKSATTMATTALLKALRDADRNSVLGTNRPLVTRLGDIMDAVQAARAQGMSDRDIWKVLHQNGLDFTQASFNTCVFRLRKKRRAFGTVPPQGAVTGGAPDVEMGAAGSADSTRKGVVTYSEDEIARIGAQLKAIPAPERKKTSAISKQDAILALADEINALRTKGYTLPEITEVLNTAGLVITRQTLQGYLLRAKRQKESERRRLTVVDAQAA